MSAMGVPEKLSVLSGLFIYAGNFKKFGYLVFLKNVCNVLF